MSPSNAMFMSLLEIFVPKVIVPVSNVISPRALNEPSLPIKVPFTIKFLLLLSACPKAPNTSWADKFNVAPLEIVTSPPFVALKIFKS